MSGAYGFTKDARTEVRPPSWCASEHSAGLGAMIGPVSSTLHQKSLGLLRYAAPGPPTRARFSTVVSLMGSPIVQYCQPSISR